MDLIFEHPVFDSSKRQLQKPQKTFENSLYTCFKCVSNKVFLLQNRSSLLTKERLYSRSVEIATINGEMDKQRLSKLKKAHLK